ncbi:CHASE domain-containing protein, partial [Psychrilyobacter sp. S5]
MRSNTNKSYIPSYFILFLGFSLSCLIFYEIKILEKKFTQYKFKGESENYLSILNSELSKNINVLDAVKQLFLSSKNVDREEFKIFTEKFLEDNKKIQSLSWVPLVKSSERKEYERSAQREGYKKKLTLLQPPAPILGVF